MAANGISTLPTKQARQIAKLELAKLKRATTGRRSVYDLLLLPTLYAIGDNNTNNVIDNPNIGGLVLGRPWTDEVPPPPPPPETSILYYEYLLFGDELMLGSSQSYALDLVLGDEQ